MFKRASSILAFVVLSSFPVLAAESVGFRELTLPTSGEQRALNVALWYPSDDDRSSTLVGDNAAFVGLAVVPDGALRPGRYPLVVLSYGYGGNWTNQGWLANALARRGYIVAAPNHPGTTTRDMDPSEESKLWKRPSDISHVIDALTTDAALAGIIDPDRIAIIGHSLGGWTSIEIAGGRFDAERFEAECGAHAELAACDVYRQLGAGRDAQSKTTLGRDLKDKRVKAVISLDLGLARGFDPASLTAIDLESKFLADHLPAIRTRYVEIVDAMHVSFLAVCKPGGAALLEEDTPGDGIICQDGGDRGRAAVHQQVVALVTVFLSEVLRRE